MRRSVKQLIAVVVLSTAVLGSQPLFASQSRSSDPIGRTFASILAKIKKVLHFTIQDEPVIPHP